MRLLLYIAAAASAQTRITNWEEQHQRFVRQARGRDGGGVLEYHHRL